MKPFSLLFSFLLWSPAAAMAQPADEPGTVNAVDEPRLSLKEGVLSTAPGTSLPMFRLEVGFGYSSLLVDPDVGGGYGGGFFFAWGLHHRLGVELTVFFTSNSFTGQLGSYGASFMAGNITVGPILQLTRPGSRFSITADLGLGAYIVVPVLQENTWSLGISGGLTFGLRFTRWFGIGVKLRYHLFNLARISGPEYRDLKSFNTVGVVDRLEIPGYLAFYF
jgi:hypothetical protein